MNINNKEQVRELIEGCKRGNRKSQRILYEIFYRKMLGVCMRYCDNMAEAEDLVQDGFIKIFDKIPSYNYKGSFEGWIRRLIVNNTIDELRRKKRMKFNYEEESKIGNLKDEYPEEKEEMDILKLKAEVIIELIQKLSPAYKTVFNLYVVDDLSHKEIAEKLNISVGTSKSNLSKAKIKLRKLYSNTIEHEIENKI